MAKKAKRKTSSTKTISKKHISEHVYDRDKNLSYVPNDESITEVISPRGVVVDIIHPSHKTKKKRSK